MKIGDILIENDNCLLWEITGIDETEGEIYCHYIDEWGQVYNNIFYIEELGHRFIISNKLINKFYGEQ